MKNKTLDSIIKLTFIGLTTNISITNGTLNNYVIGMQRLMDYNSAAFTLSKHISLSLSPSGPLSLCPFLVIKIYFIVCFLCVGHTLFYRCILVCLDASVAVVPPFSVFQVTSGQSLHLQIIQLHQYKGIEISSKP